MSDITVSTDDILPLVEQRLAEYLNRTEGISIRNMNVFRVYSKAFSRTTYLTVDTSKEMYRFVLKQIRNHPENSSVLSEANQATVEFDVLTRFYQCFEDIERCSIPRPIIVLPERCAYVMEFIDGHLMAEDLRFARILTSSKKAKALADHYYLCGRWLRHFQAVAGIQTRRADAIDSTLTRIEDRMRLIEQVGDARLPSDFCRRVIAMLKELTLRMSDEEVLITSRHGDFGPWNVMVGTHGISVIDFFGCDDDLVPIDILKMLLHFEFARLHPLASYARNDLYRKRFLAGFGPLPNVPQSQVLFSEAIHRIRGVHGVVARRQRSVVGTIQYSRCLKAHLQWLLVPQQRRSLWPSGESVLSSRADSGDRGCAADR